MRTIITVVTIVLLTVPACSQEMSGGKRHRNAEQKTEKPKKPDDKAYNAALGRIPDRTYDPWRGTR